MKPMLPFTPFTAPEHQDFTLPGGRPAVLLVHGYPGTPHEMHAAHELPFAKSASFAEVREAVLAFTGKILE